MTSEKEVLRNVLELYKDMPYLFNKTDSNYMNKNIRNDGYSVLLSVYKSYEPTATMKTFKKKMDNLRTNYLKESKKVKLSKQSGAGSEEIYQPTVWYYDCLSFLESTTTPCRPIRDTLESDENSSLSTEETDAQPTTSSASSSNHFKKKKTSLSSAEIYEQPTISPASRSNRLKKKNTDASIQKEILERASNLMNSSEENWEITGKSIGLQLKQITNPQQHAIAQKLISDVIFYGVMNKLSENSVIDLRTPTSYLAGHSSNEFYSRSPFPSTPSPQHVKSPYPSPVPSMQMQRPNPKSSFTSFSPLHMQTSQASHVHSPEPPPLMSSAHQQTSQASHVQPAEPPPLMSSSHQQTSQASHVQSPEPPPLMSSAHQQTSQASPQYHIHSSGTQHRPSRTAHHQDMHSLPQYQVQPPIQYDDVVELHIPYPSSSNNNDNINNIVFEGAANVMKDFLVFGKKKK